MTPADLEHLRTLYRQISRRHSVYEKFAPALERALRELEETPLVVQLPKITERTKMVALAPGETFRGVTNNGPDTIHIPASWPIPRDTL